MSEIKLKLTLIILSTIGILLTPIIGTSQDTLTLALFLDIVERYHPLIKKAELYDNIQDAYELKSRGVLDPKLNSEYNTKSFKDTDYFTVWQTEAKVPTTLPIDLSVGYERNQGVFLDPQNNVPTNGLAYGTINLSILRGLLFDEQRYSIKQAELNGMKGQIEQDILHREVIYQAIRTYLEWTEGYLKLSISEEFRDLIRVRHTSVIDLFNNGAIPAIDTTESRVNLNTAEKSYYDSYSDWIGKQQKLSLFIWDAEGNPMQIMEDVQPMPLNSLIDELEAYSEILNLNFLADPYLRKIDNNIASLELTNKLEREFLKPQLDLKYNTIINFGDNSFDPTFNINDYKYGIGLELPIRNRKTKGEIKLNEAIIEQNQQDKYAHLGKIRNNYEALVIRSDIQKQVIGIAEEKIRNSKTLNEAEQLKFSLGESSIFLVNQRERKLLEAKYERVKSYTSLGQILNDLYYLRLGQETLE